MNDYLFFEQIKKKFRYLIDHYNFVVVNELYEPEAFGNGLVQFRSASLDITVVLDRGRVLIDLAPYPNPSNYKFGLLSVIEFLAPEAGEMAYIYPEEPADYDGKIDWQLNRLADLLQQYCVPVLRGEFSNWQELADRRQKQAAREYRALTGKDPLKIDTAELRDELQQEIDRRTKEQKRSILEQQEEKARLPWWVFWRHR